jgi:uncharacterized phage infection (PIP) family protein YhgE
MFRYGFLRTAAIALGVYGALGLLITAAMVVVGYTTFSQVSRLQKGLDTERESLVLSIRTVSMTVADTSAATQEFQKSIEGAQAAANTASGLANQTAGTFRQLALGLNLQVFGVQPFGGVSPQFDQSADQLQQLAITLGQTRDALGQNRSDVRRVGNDLAQLQRQLDAVARALDQPGILGASQQLLPFQVAFYGMCLLVLLQSIFSVVAGVALYRLQQALGSESLVSVLRQRATQSSVPSAQSSPKAPPPGSSEPVPL